MNRSHAALPMTTMVAAARACSSFGHGWWATLHSVDTNVPGTKRPTRRLEKRLT